MVKLENYALTVFVATSNWEIRCREGDSAGGWLLSHIFNLQFQSNLFRKYLHNKIFAIFLYKFLLAV